MGRSLRRHSILRTATFVVERTESYERDTSAQATLRRQQKLERKIEREERAICEKPIDLTRELGKVTFHTLPAELFLSVTRSIRVSQMERDSIFLVSLRCLPSSLRPCHERCLSSRPSTDSLWRLGTAIYRRLEGNLAHKKMPTPLGPA